MILFMLQSFVKCRHMYRWLEVIAWKKLNQNVHKCSWFWSGLFIAVIILFVVIFSSVLHHFLATFNFLLVHMKGFSLVWMK